MKIKRFLAPDMRQAMRDVRAEQGADAVILSTRRLEEASKSSRRSITTKP
jgi:flagellar biosynthesis protein FlhF